MEDFLKRAHILLVDDDVSTLCLLENVLNRLGFAKIRKLSNPLDVEGEIKAQAPDLIITDLVMPQLDGIALITRIRKIYPDDLDLPIIVLSGSIAPQEKRKALTAGATDILQKPFDAAEILMRIRGALRSRELHFELKTQNLLLEAKVAERTKELQDSQNQVIQRERFRAFGEMASGVVHDFNNALVSVIGYSELLLGDEEAIRNPETVREYLRIMHTAGRDATHVVGRLRDFYRPREETDVFTQLDFNKLLTEAVALTQPKWQGQARTRGVTIEVAFELEKLPQVSGSGPQLREVLMNLIFNAVDAMPQGGVITIRSRREGGHVLIEISDAGVGMTEDVRKRCFEPFFSTKGEEGTGLGLAMVFGIVNRHEAVIEVQSEIGRGTTFCLKFPAAEAEEQDSVMSPIETFQRLNVLVVDDEQVACDILSKYLRTDGHRVECVSCGEDALARLQTEGIDLMLTDHGMPGMNGVQLIDAARAFGHQQPVILMSGVDLDPRNKPDFVDSVLRKPIQQRDLRKLLAGIALN